MDDLEEFRKTWRQELSSKNVKQKSLGHLPDDNEKSSSHGVVVEAENGVSDTRPDWTPQPFVIAESLLLGETLGTPTVTPDKTYTQKNENFKRKRDGSPEQLENKKRFLDILISDLDEINEIPFFDIQIPKEVAVNIFSHLDLIDLCHCAQVSRSWKYLAEDELLWCRLCHHLGYESKVQVHQRDNWKQFVHEQIKMGKRITENWKTRTGAFYRLEHVQGGVICAAHSSNTHVVAGYTNSSVKIWHLDGGGECVFKPSHTALVVDEAEDCGTISNHVTHVAVNSKITVAAFKQGFIDIWNNERGTSPAHTIQFKPISNLGINEDVIAVTSGHQVQVIKCNDNSFSSHQVDVESEIKSIKITSLDASSKYSRRCGVPSDNIVALATCNAVQLYKIGAAFDSPSSCGIYTTYGVPVEGPIDVMDEVLACPLGADFMSSVAPYRVKLYNIDNQKEVTTLRGHTARVCALHMASANTLVTGSVDRKVRLYDSRIQHPIATFMGHTTPVSSVQTDAWKVVSGGHDGMVCVWDHRVPNVKLWELHNRHPVEYCQFNKQLLVVANIPQNKYPGTDEVDSMLQKRYRGSLHAYDFSMDQVSVAGLPSVCLSTYDEPEGYNYNIKLSMPYDRL